VAEGKRGQAGVTLAAPALAIANAAAAAVVVLRAVLRAGVERILGAVRAAEAAVGGEVGEGEKERSMTSVDQCERSMRLNRESRGIALKRKRKRRNRFLER
jgi:hypothetical protein